MSIRIDDYIKRVSAIAPVAPLEQKPTETELAENASQDGDSYISTMKDENEPIPCENYNDILHVMRRYKAEAAQAEASSDEESDFAKQPKEPDGVKDAKQTKTKKEDKK